MMHPWSGRTIRNVLNLGLLTALVLSCAADAEARRNKNRVLTDRTTRLNRSEPIVSEETRKTRLDKRAIEDRGQERRLVNDPEYDKKRKQPRTMQRPERSAMPTFTRKGGRRGWASKLRKCPESGCRYQELTPYAQREFLDH